MEEKVFVSAPLNCLRCLPCSPLLRQSSCSSGGIILNNEPICIHLLSTGTAGIAFAIFVPFNSSVTAPRPVVLIAEPLLI